MPNLTSRLSLCMQKACPPMLSGPSRAFYGIDASMTMISKVTDKIMPLISEWQSRTLDRVYLIILKLPKAFFHIGEHAVYGHKKNRELVFRAIKISFGLLF